MDSYPVERTADTHWPTVEDRRIDHRRFDIAMPQQFLNGSNVRAAFEQVRGKRMAKRMARGPLGEPGLRHSLSDAVIRQGDDGLVRWPYR